MKFTLSLKKNSEYRNVYNRGKSIANRNLVVYVLKNYSPYNLLGVSVSKKVGNSVIRSRCKRLIKESYRTIEENMLPGYSIVIIARTSAKGLPFIEIKKSIIHLFKKHDIYSQLG